MITINNYINGAYCAPKKNEYLDNFNPADGSVYSKLARSNNEDVEEAVKAAEQAFKSWKSTSLETRFTLLNKIADLIEENLDALARAESLDNGKPISLAKSVDIPRAASNFRFFATGIMHFASESHEMPNTAINYTLRRPIGVVGCISPWNLPLYLFTWKIAPALAAGNCVVAKPSEVTPYTAFLLGEICSKAGLPKGVLNIVHGLGAEVGNAITVHPKIKAISFTGGTSTGAQIASKTAPMFKKLSLELGGKNPTIVFNDCNYEATLDTVVRSSFANQGQICLCSSRILVQKEIYEQFKKDFVDKVKQLKVGHPSQIETNIGAVVSKEHFEKIKQYISLAKSEGGKMLCGGKPALVDGYEHGYYLQPTVFEGLPNHCKTNQEEVFGPLVTIQSFSSVEEAIALANDSTYGLAASVHTNNIQLATSLANELHFGIVWINCWLLRDLRTPFGGVKSSGVGREGGWEALRFFTEPKNVCIKY
jgi:aminomuconate-semialdehyde/2-hydroxymuconate-6-semialdehyde dehydrogenase